MKFSPFTGAVRWDKVHFRTVAGSSFLKVLSLKVLSYFMIKQYTTHNMNNAQHNRRLEKVSRGKPKERTEQGLIYLREKRTLNYVECIPKDSQQVVNLRSPLSYEPREAEQNGLRISRIRQREEIASNDLPQAKADP